MTKKFDVYGLGQCAFDYLGIIPEYPEADTKCEFSDLTTQGGGPIATALVALQRWGYRCAFAGIVGDDDYGRQILDSIIREGVDTSNALIRKNSDSQVAIALAEPENGRRTIFWRRPTGKPFQPEEIDRNILVNARIFHTDGLFGDASVSACRLAKDSGVLVSVDAGTLRPGMMDIAASSDYFLASEPFARAFAPDTDPETVCRKLAGLGPSVTAVTLGRRGYVAWDGEKIIHGRAYQVNTIDTTGCGDMFHAGFVYGILQNWAIADCLDFGAWAAAMVSRFLGGRRGIPTIGEWQQFKNYNSK